MIYSPYKQNTGRKITFVGLCTNVGLILLKFWGGISGHSRALVADAFHSISDVISDIVVLWGLKIGDKAPDLNHHFGHGKIETITTQIMGIVIIGTGLGIGIQAALEIYHNIHQSPKSLVIIVATISVLVKESLYHLTKRTGEKINRPVLISNAWHHRSDALSSLAVVAGAAGTMLKPQWKFLDSYAAITVSCLIIKSGMNIFYQATKDIIDTAPDPEINRIIRETSQTIKEIRDIDKIRLRRSGRLLIGYVSIRVDPDISVAFGYRIAKNFERKLKKKLENILDLTVTVAPYTKSFTISKTSRDDSQGTSETQE